MGKNKPRGLRSARKLQSKYRENKWADKSYKKKIIGSTYKSPFMGASHAKGLVVAYVGLQARAPNFAMRKCVEVVLKKNGKHILAFVPNDGCLNYISENDEVVVSGCGRKGRSVGDMKGVRYKVVSVKGYSLLGLYRNKRSFYYKGDI